MCSKLQTLPQCHQYFNLAYMTTNLLGANYHADKNTMFENTFLVNLILNFAQFRKARTAMIMHQ